MKTNIASDAKIGIFVIILLGILAYLTVDVSNLAFSPGATYEVFTIMESAEGISNKTPVQVAGIAVGVVETVELIDNRRARVGMKIKKNVAITKDMTVTLKTRGVLGDVYLELLPGSPDAPVIANGGTLDKAKRAVNYQDVFANTTDITQDLKEFTKSLKEYSERDQKLIVDILKNMQTLSQNMANFSTANSANMNAIVKNLAVLTQELKGLAVSGSHEMEETLKRIGAITKKIEQGEGTIGRLLSDEETIEKTHAILDDVKTLTEPVGRLRFGMDYHLEFLGQSGEYKNVFNVKLASRPDKYFLFGVVHNSLPPPDTSTTTEVFNTNGTETTVVKQTSDFNEVRFNAQLAKKFKDFTIRGGLIESTGGAAVEYSKGPFTIAVEGYNFGNPGHSLKASGLLNITKSLYVQGGTYLLGGTDAVSGTTFGPDWFVGAGLRFTDEDISSLLGGAGLVSP